MRVFKKIIFAVGAIIIMYEVVFSTERMSVRSMS